ncbi:hypothetical protein GGR56DRAFT_675766 [Xylariaceae sp. FL0804]|nr:hypothetical protein GGR56DRAFT_675766 [Xylariaceae sp. FL0804]
MYLISSLAALGALFLSLGWSTSSTSSSYPALQPCDTASTDASFAISSYSGTPVSDDGGDRSFTFMLDPSFNAYRTGCRGHFRAGAQKTGVEWCGSVVPGFNVSYVVSRGGAIQMSHNFKCSSGVAEEVEAVAVCAGVLDLSDDGTKLRDGRQTMPANITVL